MKYLALSLSTLALAFLTLVVVVMSQTVGTPRRTGLPVQAALRPLDQRQLQDQEEMRLAIAELMPLTQRSRAGAFASVTGGLAAGAGAAPAATSAMQYGQIFALAPQIAATTPPKKWQAGASRPVAAPIPLPRVNVVVDGGSGGRAMVNGNLVSVGDRVAGDLIVKSIDIDAVTFASGKEELEIRMPLERLRVLGAFPPQPRVD